MSVAQEVREPLLSDGSTRSVGEPTPSGGRAAASAPAAAREGEGTAVSLAERYPWIGRFLRYPLFLKIVWATSAAVAGSALLTGILLLLWTPVDPERLVGAVVLPALLAVGGGGVLAATLVHLALAPLRDLTATAHRIAGGEDAARAPLSALADEETAELIRVFNGMLDRLDEARETSRRHGLRILEAQEEERGRLAQELYDGVAQILAAVLLRLRTASPGNDGGAAEVRGALVEALEGIRRTARALSPPELRDLGVERALEACARTLAGGEGPPVDVVVAGEAGRLDPAAARALYRIVEESLRDLAGRPGKGRVEVVLRGDGDEVEAEIRDERMSNGEGSQRSDGWLRDLQERARWVGGSVEVGIDASGAHLIRLRLPRVPHA